MKYNLQMRSLFINISIVTCFDVKLENQLVDYKMMIIA